MSRSRHSRYRRPGLKLGHRRWYRRNVEPGQLAPRDRRRLDPRERGWEQGVEFVPLHGRPRRAPVIVGRQLTTAELVAALDALVVRTFRVAPAKRVTLRRIR